VRLKFAVAARPCAERSRESEPRRPGAISHHREEWTIPSEPSWKKPFSRSVLEGTGLITIAGGFSRLLSLLSAPILTRLLGPGPYGVVALLGTVTSFASMVGLAGVDHSYARYYFDGTQEERAGVERLCWRLSIAISCVIALVASVGWWMGSASLGLSGNLAVMVAAGVGLGTLNTMAVTRQRLLGAYHRIAGSIIGASGVGVALAITFAYAWRRDAWSLLLSAVIGNTIGVAIAGLPPRATYFRQSGLSLRRRGEVLRLGLAGSIIGPMYWLMNSVDRWLIGLWWGQESLGVYAFSQSVGMIGLVLNSAITLTWFPEMTRLYDADPSNSSEKIGRMWARLVGLFFGSWLAVSAAGGDVIRLVAAPWFHAGAVFIPWIAGGVLFYGIASLANTGLLLRKRLAPVAVWWVAGAIVNTALTTVLVRAYGALGAAVAGCFSYALIAIGVMATAQVRFHLVIPWRHLAAAGGLALGAGVVMAFPWAGSALASLALKFPVGLACVAAMGWIVAPDWMGRLRKREFLRPTSGTGDSGA